MSEKSDRGAPATEAEAVDTAERPVTSAEETAEPREEQFGESTPAGPVTNGAGSKLSSASLLLHILSIAGIGVLLVAGYQYWQNLQATLEQINETAVQADRSQNDLQVQIRALSDELKGSARSVEEANSEVGALSRAVASIREEVTARERTFEAWEQNWEKQMLTLKEERNKLKQDEAALKAEVASLHRRIGSNSSEWMVAEAEYLIRIANRRVHLERDLETAVMALEAADQRLAATKDPVWTAVRKVLASEITALKASARLDIIGMEATLSAMAQQVPGLKVAGTEQPMAPGIEEREVSLEETAKTILVKGWEGFKSLIVVRRHDQPVTAMLPPEQHYFIQQNLRLQLDVARFALLRGDSALYQSNLKKVLEWLDTYIVPDDAAARVMRGEIEKLMQIDIRPPLPDLSGSLRLLREQRRDAS